MIAIHYPNGSGEYSPSNVSGLRAWGFEPIALSMYGSISKPRYAGVFVLRPQHQRRFWFIAHDVPISTAVALHDETKASFDISIIAAHGNDDQARASVVLVEKPPPQPGTKPKATQFVKFGLISGKLQKLELDGIRNPATFEFWNARAQARGFILSWATTYGDSPVRFAAVWTRNSSKVVWDYSFDDTLYEHDMLFGAYGSTLLRPGFITLSSSTGRYMSMWRDDIVSDGYYARANMTREAYLAEVAKAADNGMWPSCVQAGGSASNPRFAAIFLPDEQGTRRARQWTVTGRPAPFDPPFGTFEVFDDKMKAAMQSAGARAGSLAIIYKGRLVYAKAFTWAEEGYPITQPTTLFGAGSVSKTLTAIGVFRALDMLGLGFDWILDMPVVNFLGLKTLRGGAPGIDDTPSFALPPQKSAWKAMTIRDLLSHGAGLRTDRTFSYDPDIVHEILKVVVFEDTDIPGYGPVASWESPPFVSPVPFELLIRYLAGYPNALNRWPGETFQYGYGFVLLQAVIEKLARLIHPTKYYGTFETRYPTSGGGHVRRAYDRTYERFIQKEVFGPIGVTRAAIGASYPYHRKYELDVEYPAWAEARRERSSLSGQMAVLDPGTDITAPGQWYAGPRWMITADRIRGFRYATHQNGGANYRLHGSHGSWVFSCVDYAKLLAGFDLYNNPILSPTATALMLSPAPLDAMTAQNKDLWNVTFNEVSALLGFYEMPGAARTDFNGNPVRSMLMGGAVAGCSCAVDRRHDGISFVAMFNTEAGLITGLQDDFNLIDGSMLWPNWDLFSIYAIPSFFPWVPKPDSFIHGESFGIQTA